MLEQIQTQLVAYVSQVVHQILIVYFIYFMMYPFQVYVNRIV